MGTIDPALGRDTKAMQLYLLALVLPLAAAGFDAQQMMQMMQMMNAAKGWGSSQQPGSNQGVIQQQVNQQQQQQQWQSMTNSADYEAYLKWCAENEQRQKEMEKQRIEAEAKERQENMMAQWKQWEQKMKMSSNFESLGIEIMEMKHRYYSLVVMEFLKFCKCTDKASQIQAFFGTQTSRGDLSYEEFDLSDLGLTQAQSTDARAVAQAVMGLSAQEKVKAYFYGLATQMCEGANDYFDQVEAWEKQYNFLEKLS